MLPGETIEQCLRRLAVDFKRLHIEQNINHLPIQNDNLLDESIESESLNIAA
jgi:hypothetical protein